MKSPRLIILAPDMEMVSRLGRDPKFRVVMIPRRPRKTLRFRVLGALRRLKSLIKAVNRVRTDSGAKLSVNRPPPTTPQP